MRKPIKGEKLFLVCSKKDNLSVTVSRVGRKYFYCNGGGREYKFHLRNWQPASEYLPNNLYESKEQWEQECRRNFLINELNKYDFQFCSDEQIKKIAEILDLIITL